MEGPATQTASDRARQTAYRPAGNYDALVVADAGEDAAFGAPSGVTF